MVNWLGWSFGALLALVCGSGAPVEHVVAVGCDGMSPDGVRKTDAPVMHRLMREGAWTLWARTVMPTSSSPNWKSNLASSTGGANPTAD